MDEIIQPQTPPVVPVPTAVMPPSSSKKEIVSFLNTRLNRWNYFIGNLISGLIFGIVVLGILIAANAKGISESTLIANARNPILLVLYYLWYAPLIIRRLHDLGHSGWWTIAVYLANYIPIVGLVVGLYVAFRPGKTVPNKYGPPDLTDGHLSHIFGLGN